MSAIKLNRKTGLYEKEINKATAAPTVPIVKRIFNRLGKSFGITPFPVAFPMHLAEAISDRKCMFDHIYNNNLWPSEVSKSGVGSDGRYVAAYAAQLTRLIKDRCIASIFDAPCGDLNWITNVVNVTGIAYWGGDISDSVVKAAKERHKELDIMRFDICSDRFPDVELWHCRDCLFHLPFADIRMALSNFCSSKIPRALITTHKARILRNLDVSVGGFRYLDLERPPIALPRAECYLPDFRFGFDFPRYVGLWSRASIAKSVGAWL